MNWHSVADFIGDKCCFERQRYGTCGCRARGRRGVNPCGLAARLKAACERMGDGESTDVTVEEVEGWLAKHTCNDSRQGILCNHRGCMRGERMLEFVMEWKRKKAA